MKLASSRPTEEHLGHVVLFGTETNGVTVSIQSGPERTPQFTPYGELAMDYPSVNLLAKTWNNHLYVIAVNSAEQQVTARISGLGDVAGDATVLFEDRTEQVQSGRIDDVFEGLGVHIYRAPL